MLKAIFFDLDGTLLPFNENDFIQIYFHLLSEKICPLGYEKKSLMKHIWAGVMAMYQNDGTKTNEQVFWDYFTSVYGEQALKDKVNFDAFYVNEFRQVQSICQENPLAKPLIEEIKKLGLKVILATNPIFPYQGTLTRCSFINLSEEDFDYITAYENSSYSKPNPNYYQQLLHKFDLKPEEVLLFGNNTLEDGIAQAACGIKTYMIQDFMINHENGFELPMISFHQILDVIKKHIN